MSKMTREECYEKFLEKNGLEFEMQLAVEEMSELMQVLCKYIRKNGKVPRENIMGELADVLNTVEPLANYFGRDEVEKIRDGKLKRGMGRLEIDP
ncbi:hypothetical protein FWH09_03005 [Candidatus Saccharibacteria bacterium]|nr:hypothetical protein [Candidatus Saccharibacteria bacterium]